MIVRRKNFAPGQLANEATVATHRMRAALSEQLFRRGKQLATAGDGPDRRTALLEVARLLVAVLLTHFDTSPAGLAPAEATNQLTLFGLNEITHERYLAWYVQLLAGFKNPFIAMPLTLAVVSFFTGDTKAVVVITVMVTLRVLISFLQEFRSLRTTEKLKVLVRSMVVVLRTRPYEPVEASRPQEILMQELVPGDVVHLSAGDLVPADARLLFAKDMFVAQLALTGEALRLLRRSGMRVKVLTGDSEIIAVNVCRKVSLPVDGMLLGRDVEAMSDPELQPAVDHCTVFARLKPLQKARIVGQLQARGHTMGFMGDGINDSPSPRAVDVGIPVDTAVDIAKESIDTTLLEKSLFVLVDGVIEGRKTFGNIIKYIKMTASSNFGNVFSVRGASAFLPFLPMLPIHLLVQNLFYDV